MSDQQPTEWTSLVPFEGQVSDDLVATSNPRERNVRFQEDTLPADHADNRPSLHARTVSEHSMAASDASEDSNNEDEESNSNNCSNNNEAPDLEQGSTVAGERHKGAGATGAGDGDGGDNHGGDDGSMDTYILAEEALSAHPVVQAAVPTFVAVAVAANYVGQMFHNTLGTVSGYVAPAAAAGATLRGYKTLCKTQEVVVKMDKKLDKLDKKFDRLDKKVSNLDEKVSNLDEKFDRLEETVRAIRTDIAPRMVCFRRNNAGLYLGPTEKLTECTSGSDVLKKAIAKAAAVNSTVFTRDADLALKFSINGLTYDETQFLGLGMEVFLLNQVTNIDVTLEELR